MSKHRATATAKRSPAKSSSPRRPRRAARPKVAYSRGDQLGFVLKDGRTVNGQYERIEVRPDRFVGTLKGGEVVMLDPAFIKGTRITELEVGKTVGLVAGLGAGVGVVIGIIAAIANAPPIHIAPINVGGLASQ